ncbi:hypothetical protein HOD29_05375 [archaeon]|jgi:hypothetical protein|nr:hypothetical protein [archaeon]
MKGEISYIFVFGILLVLSLGFVSSFEVEDNFDLSQISCDMLNGFKDEIVGQEIPSQIPYKNEIFNVYIAEEIFGNIVIEESIVKDFGCVVNDEVTYRVYILDGGVLLDFAETEEVMELVQEKLDNKEILVKGVGLGKKIKWSFTKLLLKWFG